MSGNDFMPDSNETFDPADIQANKTVAGLGYILFFLPLLACPNSKFGRYHANQSLLLLLTSVAGNILLSVRIFDFFGILRGLFGLVVFVYFILGLVNALNGQAKELPLIGKLRIIQY